MSVRQGIAISVLSIGFLFVVSSVSAKLEVNGQVLSKSTDEVSESHDGGEVRPTPSPRPTVVPVIQNLGTGSKIDVEKSGDQLHIQVVTPKTTHEIDNENEIETETPDGEHLKIASGSGDMMVISKNGVEASTKEKLVLNLDSKQVSVSGQPVKITPDQIRTNINGSIVLEMRQGQPVYKVEGNVTKKLFGLFDLSFHQVATVSAETGTVTVEPQSIVNRILQALSF